MYTVNSKTYSGEQGWGAWTWTVTCTKDGRTYCAGTVTRHDSGHVQSRDQHDEPLTLNSPRDKAMRVAVVRYEMEAANA